MAGTRPTHGSNRRDDVRVQQSLLVAGAAMFLVGLATLSGAVDPGTFANGITERVDVGDAVVDTPTEDDGGAATPSPESDPNASATDTETPTTLTATVTPTPAGKPTDTPTPTEEDDSILGDIVDWSTPTATPTAE